MRDVASTSSSFLKSKETILLSDDFALRTIAGSEYGVSGVWTASFLGAALARREIDPEDYVEKSIELIEAGYSFISINATTILRSLKDSAYKISERVVKVTSLLGGAHSGLEGSVNVVAECLLKLEQTILPPTSETSIAIHIIEQYIKDRKTEEAIRILKLAIKSRSQLRPLSEMKWVNVLDTLKSTKRVVLS